MAKATSRATRRARDGGAERDAARATRADALGKRARDDARDARERETRARDDAMATPRGKKRRAATKPLFASMKSMKRAREVTSEFHAVTRVLDDARASKEAKARAKATLEAMGGRDAYQEASALTTARHRTAKWTFSVLTRRNRRPKRGERALKTLEVGAINTDLMSAKFLDVRAIDVKSRHPKIEQLDFFDMPVEAESYDVIHSSMVVNCVPTAELRGEMIARTATFLRPKGLFFMMLPLRCVTASTRMSQEKMSRLLRACGLRVVEQKRTPKIVFYCCEKLDKPTEALIGKELVRRDAREAFAKSERVKDAGGDPSHFGIILEDEHLCGY